jgi:mandelate racemase
MSLESLTLKSIRARPVVLKLNRPVVARIATFVDWPLILIDLYTEEGVIGRSYLEPYIRRSMRYLIPALHDLGEMLKGRRLAPIEFYEAGRKSLHFVGYEGMAMIAVAGVDMAAWDALARAAGVPLRVLLGGSIGAVPAYNSNGPLVEISGGSCKRGCRVTRGGRVPGSEAASWPRASSR